MFCEAKVLEFQKRSFIIGRLGTVLLIRPTPNSSAFFIFSRNCWHMPGCYLNACVSGPNL